MSDIDTVVVDSLKALDPKRPIREADIIVTSGAAGPEVKRQRPPFRLSSAWRTTPLAKA